MTDANLTKLFIRGCTRVIQKNRLRSRDAQILLSLCIQVFHLKHLRSRAIKSIAIKTKTRGITRMVNRALRVWIIQTFEILKWQLFFQNAFVGCYSSAPSLKMDTKNTTACRVPLHDSVPSFMNFRRVLDLLEFKNKVSQRFAGNQRCPGVWNSFPFLAWDLSMHPRTHILFFNEFICIRACASSSNLNYAHECIENSVNV